MNNIVYVYRTFFKSVYVYSDGSNKTSKESLQSIYYNLGDEKLVKIKKYILNIECIRKVRKGEITLNNGILIKLNKKNFDTVRWVIHCYYRDRLH